MLSFAKRTMHPWTMQTNIDAFKWHGPARHHDWEAIARETEANQRKERGSLSKVREKAHSLWAGVKGITADLAKPAAVNTLSPATSPATDQPQTQSSFFSKLPVEIRHQIYVYVVAGYSDTIHVLAGNENGYPSRTLFHTPCITPLDLEVPRWSIFDKSRWSSGPWGSYHFYCDLYSTKPSVFHLWVLRHEEKAMALGDSRTAYEVVREAKQKFSIRAPFLPLLLCCRRFHDEAIKIVFSSLTLSFIGDCPLSIFTRSVQPSLIQSLQLIHLAWPSWWKTHLWAHNINGNPRPRREFWFPPEPDPLTMRADWEELWRSFLRIGRVKRLHVTIFQIWSEEYEIDVIHIEELLPALCSIRADEFFVEAWAEEARIEEPSEERPFRLRYNPRLGLPNS